MANIRELSTNHILEDHAMIAREEYILTTRQLLPGDSLPAQHYSDDSFWRKLGRYASTAGREVAEKSLYLYYAAQDPNMPRWARAVAYGALGYFILPADAIPDIIPGAGYTDDLGVIAAALAVVIAHITPEVKQKARRTLARWFAPQPPDTLTE